MSSITQVWGYLRFAVASARVVQLAVVICLIPQDGCSRHTQPAPKVVLGPVVCLKTNWFPSDAPKGDESQSRLGRELMRQAVLIALRDDLGYVTRDETLEEPISAAQLQPSESRIAPNAQSKSAAANGATSAEPLDVSFHITNDGKWEAHLYGAGTSFNNPVWHHGDSLPLNRRTVYSQLAAQLDKQCSEIAEQLQRAGAKGDAPKQLTENKPGPDIEQLFLSMNFVSQFAAVRTAHNSISRKGLSLEWLSILVRGYANLAMLTEHTWSSHSEAFAARSLLYAERMCRLSGGTRLAKWHRAYARALVGMHAMAIEDIDQMAGTPEDKLPEWTNVVKPYVEFDGSKWTVITAQHPHLAELVALLEWDQIHNYMHGRWIYERGLAAAKKIPEAYSIYSVMANWKALGTKRTGASLGSRAFGGLLPKRMLTLKKLSDEDQEIQKAIGDLVAEHENTIDGRKFRAAPMKLAEGLRSIATREAKPSECSWSILAELIAEEQFVEAANLLHVSGDATEHSDEDLVNSLLPLVKGHRYAALIQSYALPPANTQQAQEILQELSVIDPRPCMQQMFSKTWRTRGGSGYNGNDLQWRAIWERNSTLPDLRDVLYDLTAGWTLVITPADQQRYSEDIQAVSPKCPIAIRGQWEMTQGLKAADLEKFEPQIKEDPVGWMSLGNYYFSLANYDAAERCLKKSLSISPSYDATKTLANTYFSKNRKDLWQTTLESYLQVEDLGLTHSDIHQQIAEQFLHDRDWKKAVPHAVAAAEAYSATGLMLASRVFEGAQDWQRSEFYAAETSRNYPSYFAGTTWYFWCRRNGRGDLEGARAIADKCIELASRRGDVGDVHRTFVYRVLEGHPAEALDEMEQKIVQCRNSEDIWDTMWRLLHVIALSNELKDTTRKQEALKELAALNEEQVKPQFAYWAPILEGLSDAFNGKPPSDAFLKTLDESLKRAALAHQANYYYFVGTAFDQLGNKKKADHYWGLAAFCGAYDSFNATLAGSKLVKHHGPDRGGLPPEFAAIEAAVVKQDEGKKDAACTEPPISNAGGKSSQSPADSTKPRESVVPVQKDDPSKKAGS